MSKSVKKATPIRFHEGLQQLRKDAGGMDIGAGEIWVDVGFENDSEPVRRFETFTADLNRMAEWLIDCGIKTVVMESTGVYWIPACQILEDKGIEVLLVNPRYAKNVSGRKTDALDCQWLRTLHCYGLLPASFRPAREIASLRSYLRHRQMLIEYAAAHIQHMQKAMTQMNLQLHHVHRRHYRPDGVENHSGDCRWGAESQEIGEYETRTNSRERGNNREGSRR
jgi:transposase